MSVLEKWFEDTIADAEREEVEMNDREQARELGRKIAENMFASAPKKASVQYCVGVLPTSCYATAGDSIQLSINNKIVTARAITMCEVFTHWAWLGIENTCEAYFTGGENLKTILAERFPDAQVLEE